MERVQGIGGFFFSAGDPASLGRWYAQHLGVRQAPATYEDAVWEQAPGPTVFAPFGSDAADSRHLGPSGWGINFRVRDLDAMVRQLQGAGLGVEVDPQEYPNGRFAHLQDPEGNPVQLWEQRAADISASPRRRDG